MSMGSDLFGVSCTAIKHYMFPLLQIQTHRLRTLWGRKRSFDRHHPHFVFPRYFRPLFSKSALIVPCVKPNANRLTSHSRNLIPRNGFSRSQSVDVDVSLFQSSGVMSRQFVNEL